jgi:type IV secretory pathway VirB9-like protein
MNTKLIFIAGLALALPAIAGAQDASARTVQYHSQDIIPIHAKLKYTTLIEVPTTEKIMEAATGDKDFWVVDVVGNFCFVHPAKAGISSNLNLITDKGNIYYQRENPRLCRGGSNSLTIPGVCLSALLNE